MIRYGNGYVASATLAIACKTSSSSRCLSPAGAECLVLEASEEEERWRWGAAADEDEDEDEL